MVYISHIPTTDDRHHTGYIKGEPDTVIHTSEISHRSMSLIPPSYRFCDLCASLVRPQNWLGHRSRHIGGKKVALVVQVWRRGRSDLAMVAMKFWACSKQLHKCRRGGWSIGRSPHKIIRTVVNIVYQFVLCFCFHCTTTVPPLADQ